MLVLMPLEQLSCLYFFFGKYKSPRCFKQICKDSLPVYYNNQKNAWMTASLFSTWFHNEFVPTIKIKLTELGVEPKALLLLDNCSAHPDEDELVSSDGKIEAVFLPPNVTSLIQPMDQGVHESIKRRYRRKLLEELLFKNDEGVSVIDFLTIDMLKVINLIASSWDEISSATLQLSWRKILSSSTSSEDTGSDDTASDASDEDVLHDCSSLLHELGVEMTRNEVQEWLLSDIIDQGYTHLNDDEIVQSVVNESESAEIEETETEPVTTMSHSEYAQPCSSYLARLFHFFS